MPVAINKSQLICINTLISKLQLQKEKKDMVNGFSSGRTETSKELSFDEATAMISYLKSRDPDEKRSENMKNYIIQMAHQMFWHLPNTRKIDMKRLNNWCIKFGYLHKKLDDHSYKELPTLVTQFEKVLKDYLNGV